MKAIKGDHSQIKIPTAEPGFYYKDEFVFTYSALTFPLLFAITSSAILFGAGA
jgi:hypothetical protein